MTTDYAVTGCDLQTESCFQQSRTLLRDGFHCVLCYLQHHWKNRTTQHRLHSARKDPRILLRLKKDQGGQHRLKYRVHRGKGQQIPFQRIRGHEFLLELL